MIIKFADIEANGLETVKLDKGSVVAEEADRIWCISIKTQGDDNVRRYLEHELDAALEDLNDCDMVVGHNWLQYDQIVIERLVGKLTAKQWDTLVVSKNMHPDIQSHAFLKYEASSPNSLEAWGEHLGFPKIDYQGGWESYSEEMGVYCDQDVRLSEAIYDAQLSFYEANKSWVDAEMQCTEILARQKVTGFGYNLEEGEKLEQTLVAGKAEITDRLNEAFPPTVEETKTPQYWVVTHIPTGKTEKRATKGECDKARRNNFWRPKECTFERGPMKTKTHFFNPGSGQQIANRLIEKHGWKPAEFTDGGQPSTGEDVLKHLDFPEVKMLLEWARYEKLQKAVQDWNMRARMSHDGRIHGHVNVQGAIGGRCTHSQPNVSQVDGDPRARELWIPGVDDYVVVGCDLSGLELRMLSHYFAFWDKGAYADIVVSGDIHTYHQQLLGLPPGKPGRVVAKTFIYAFIYGAMGPKIGTITNRTAAEGTKLIKTFERNLPVLGKLKDASKLCLKKYGGLKLVDDRIVPVRKMSAILNLLLQGGGGIVSKRWMIDADERITAANLRAKQMCYSHDELQFMAHKDDAQDVANILVSSAIRAGEFYDLRVPIEAEADIGTSWKDTH